MYGTEAIQAYNNVRMPKGEIKKSKVKKKFGLLSRNEVTSKKEKILSPEESISSMVDKLRKARQGLK
jgi:hypothetical protein|tara:strand:+ start:284 stop:484 length:201 start_codon:yes stop_codon:yes gene_type:complete